jgi:hypothetical protein
MYLHGLLIWDGRVRFSFRTLGMFWNGSSWTIQKSYNL